MLSTTMFNVVIRHSLRREAISMEIDNNTIQQHLLAVLLIATANKMLFLFFPGQVA